MTGSRVNSWALSIAGDVPPPLQIPQPSREVHKHPNAHDQVNVSIPPFNGRFKPALYIEWEFDIKNIFASHNFNEHKKVKVAERFPGLFFFMQISPSPFVDSVTLSSF